MLKKEFYFYYFVRALRREECIFHCSSNWLMPFKLLVLCDGIHCGFASINNRHQQLLARMLHSSAAPRLLLLRLFSLCCCHVKDQIIFIRSLTLLLLNTLGWYSMFTVLGATGNCVVVVLCVTYASPNPHFSCVFCWAHHSFYPFKFNKESECV